MKTRNQILIGTLSAFAMLLLILDAKTALSGARDGITLCLYTVIPSLFPFIVLSVMISSATIGSSAGFLRPISKLCGMPVGSESLLLLGLLGGYPVGAQSIYQAYQNGQVQKNEARRMLGFCNNAGPAFIFGIVGGLFSSLIVPWSIWLIHIVSAILVGIILPSKTNSNCVLTASARISVTQALERGLHIMATICGWVVLFRIIMAVCERWFLWILPAQLQYAFCGLLELSNGCYALQNAERDGMKFIFSSCFLAAGGLCVTMQTAAVTKELGTGMYLTGKVLQCAFSFIIASFVQQFLFSADSRLYISFPVILSAIAFVFLLIWRISAKNRSSNLAPVDV